MPKSEASKLDDACGLYPGTFGLRAYPGRVFRVARAHSYIDGGVIRIMLDIEQGGGWLSFGTTTVIQLGEQIVRSKEGHPSQRVRWTGGHRLDCSCEWCRENSVEVEDAEAFAAGEVRQAEAARSCGGCENGECDGCGAYPCCEGDGGVGEQEGETLRGAVWASADGAGSAAD